MPYKLYNCMEEHKLVNIHGPAWLVILEISMDSLSHHKHPGDLSLAHRSCWAGGWYVCPTTRIQVIWALPTGHAEQEAGMWQSHSVVLSPLSCSIASSRRIFKRAPHSSCSGHVNVSKVNTNWSHMMRLGCDFYYNTKGHQHTCY